MSLPRKRETLWTVLALSYCFLINQVSCRRDGPGFLSTVTSARKLGELHPWSGGMVLPLELGNLNTPNFQLYYTTIEIGTPPQTLKVACDTASSLLWINCECALSREEGGDPDTTDAEDEGTGCAVSATPFDPQGSSTVRRPVCTDPVCQVDQSAVTTCEPALTGQVCTTVPYAPSFCKAQMEDTCPYFLSYSDDSYTTGVILTDMLSVTGLSGDSVRVPFGCGQSQGGHFHDDLAFGQFSGLIGLGRGNSVVSLLAEAAAERDEFSLCLGGERGGSVLVIGDVLRPPEGRASARLLPPPSPDDSFYTLPLQALRVGQDDILSDLPLYPSGGQSRAIIDSGATYTVLPQPIFAAFTEALIRSLSPSLPRAYPEGLDLIGPSLPPCWDPSGVDTAKLTAAIPTVTLVFGGGGELDIPPPNLMRFVPISEQDRTMAVCVGVIPGGPYNATSVVVGENWLRNLFLTFDRAQGSLSWARVDCLTGNATLDRTLRPNNRRTSRNAGFAFSFLGGVDPLVALALVALSGLAVVWIVYRKLSTSRRRSL